MVSKWATRHFELRVSVAAVCTQSFLGAQVVPASRVSGQIFASASAGMSAQNRQHESSAVATWRLLSPCCASEDPSFNPRPRFCCAHIPVHTNNLQAGENGTKKHGQAAGVGAPFGQRGLLIAFSSQPTPWKQLAERDAAAGAPLDVGTAQAAAPWQARCAQNNLRASIRECGRRVSCRESAGGSNVPMFAAGARRCPCSPPPALCG